MTVLQHPRLALRDLQTKPPSVYSMCCGCLTLAKISMNRKLEEGESLLLEQWLLEIQRYLERRI